MRRDKRNKRRLAGILTAVLCIAALSGGCAPTEQTVVQRGPDFSPTENVALDFVQLHNDTLDCFGGVEENPYVYIMDLNITGDNDEKSIVIDAVCMDDTTEEEADQFAAAVIRHGNDSAVTQSTEYTISSQQDFGNLFDKYSLTFTVRPESTQEDPDTYPVNLQLAAGEEIPLDPDIETFEEEWLEGRDRYLEQMANQPVQLSGGEEAETESAE